MSKGFVTAHKKGRQIVFKPSNIYTFKVIKEIKDTFLWNDIKTVRYFSDIVDNRPIPDVFRAKLRASIPDVIRTVLKDKSKSLEEVLSLQVYNSIFNYYEIDVDYSSTLINFIKKETRKQEVENTPFSTAVVSTDLPLFDRCTTGTNLICIKDYKAPNDTVIFTKGERYMVVDTGDEIDKVVISTNRVRDGATMSLAGTGARHEWTPFDSPMEEWFDDSAEGAIPETTLSESYPHLISAARKKLDKLDLALFDHVKEDAIAHSLKRASMDCKLMRMGKSSTAIAAAEIAGSQKVAIITTKNIRIFWEKEFKRLKIKNYVIVNKLADLKKEGKYYVFTYNWIRSVTDTVEKDRKAGKNYLKPAAIAINYKTNYCPHCSVPLVRPNLKADETGRVYREWDVNKGYMCINKECSHIVDNSKKKGAAWHNKTVTTSKTGSYVDVYLAQHANCDPSLVKGRQCPTCKVTEGTWKPPIARRFNRDFTMVIEDEIHNAKAINTLTAAGAFSFRAKRKMGLTGTPMSNSAMDVYWPMHWLYGSNSVAFPYDRLEGYKKFENNFCQHVYLEKPTGEVDEKGNEIIKVIRKRIPFLADPVAFWKFIGPKVVRRTYSDELYQQSLINAGLKLPSMDIKKLICPMHPEQAGLMLSALKNFKDQFENIKAEAEEENKEVNEAIVISQMATLRTIATSPERLNERLGKGTYIGPDGGGKTGPIAGLVRKKVEAGEKVVILSDFNDMQKAMEEELKDCMPIRFQTSWDDEKRAEAFKNFAEDDKHMVFIAGTRAVREGVDLSRANSVICCDLLWSPAFQAQAWSRTMAPTKLDRNCEIYLVLSKNSLDEHIFGVFYSKMTAAEQAFDKKVVARRAQHVDIRSFVDRVLEDEAALSFFVRDYDEGSTYAPMMDVTAFEERM